MCSLKKGMRGVVFYISKRYSQANKKYSKSYDPKQGLKHINYLDATNFYGYTISKCFPAGEFKWIDTRKFD